MQVNGDLANIKTYVLEKLKALYELKVPIGQISTRELNEEMLAVTEDTEREVAVYLNRQGKVVQVSLGDTATHGRIFQGEPGAHDPSYPL